MNRQQATELLQKYRDFPATGVFNARPTNYPLFHLLECYTKPNWDINVLGNNQIHAMFDFNIEAAAREIREGKHYTWTYVARNRELKNTMIALVQEDLYGRYVGRLNPLRMRETSATFIPWDKIKGKEGFDGKIGKYTKLYALEIDLDIVDVVGKWNDEVPWHYLQQTIEWKPFTDRIPWQEGPDQEPPPGQMNGDPVPIHNPQGRRIVFQQNPEPYQGRVVVNRNVYQPAQYHPPAVDGVGQEVIQGMEDVRRQAYANARDALNRAFENRNGPPEEAQRAADVAYNAVRIVAPDLVEPINE